MRGVRGGGREEEPKVGYIPEYDKFTESDGS